MDPEQLRESEIDAIADRVVEVLPTGQYGDKFMLSRRQLLSVASGTLGVGALAGVGARDATAQDSTGTVGTDGKPVDLITGDLTVNGGISSDSLETTDSITDAAGVTHTGELADIDDVGDGGGGTQSTVTFAVRRTSSDEYEVTDASGSVVFTETDVSNGHTAIAYAVDNLPADGGRVVLGEGQFNINENEINLSSNDTLTGQGRGTVLRFNDGISLADPSGAITIEGTSSDPVVNAEVSHLAIDGNKENVSAGHLDAELINVAEAEEVSIHHTYGFDAINEHIDLDATTNSAIYNNYAENCDGWGIHNSVDSGQNRIVYNYVANCGVANTRGGIDQFKNSAGDCVFVGNIAVNNYRNYEIEASGAIATGNKSISGDNSDVWTGVESAGDSGSAGDGGGSTGTLTTGDVVTASGDGSTSRFALSHSHGQTPSTVSVDPGSEDANSAFYVSAKTSTEVDVTFASAPPSGTDNLTFEIVSVGEGSTSSVTIDNFEDGDIDEYGGSTTDWSVTQTTVFSGDNSLETSISNPGGINSQSGLERYPEQGDTFSVWIRGSGGSDVMDVYWALQSSGAPQDVDDRHHAWLDLDKQEIKIFSNDGSSDATDISASSGTWYELEVTWGSTDMTVELFDDSGTSLGTATTTAGDLTDGGFGFDCNNRSGNTSTKFFDNARIR